MRATAIFAATALTSYCALLAWYGTILPYRPWGVIVSRIIRSSSWQRAVTTENNAAVSDPGPGSMSLRPRKTSGSRLPLKETKITKKPHTEEHVYGKTRVLDRWVRTSRKLALLRSGPWRYCINSLEGIMLWVPWSNKSPQPSEYWGLQENIACKRTDRSQRIDRSQRCSAQTCQCPSRRVFVSFNTLLMRGLQALRIAHMAQIAVYREVLVFQCGEAERFGIWSVMTWSGAGRGHPRHQVSPSKHHRGTPTGSHRKQLWAARSVENCKFCLWR